jgi:hypothetical protein
MVGVIPANEMRADCEMRMPGDLPDDMPLAEDGEGIDIGMENGRDAGISSRQSRRRETRTGWMKYGALVPRATARRVRTSSG